MIRWRRLVKDYEQRIDVAEAMIHITLGSISKKGSKSPIRKFLNNTSQL